MQIRFTSPNIHLRRVGYYETIAERSEAQGDGIYTLKPPQFRFTSPSIHLRRVGYYKRVAERSKAQGEGIYTLETTAI